MLFRSLGLEAMPETRAGLYDACRALGIVTEESWSWDRMRAWQHLRAQLPPDPIPEPPPEPKPSAAAEPVPEAPAKPKAKAKAKEQAPEQTPDAAEAPRLLGEPPPAILSAGSSPPRCGVRSPVGPVASRKFTPPDRKSTRLNSSHSSVSRMPSSA